MKTIIYKCTTENKIKLKIK